MSAIIGIRREDKNEWERRVPLIPSDLSSLREKYGLRVLVQPSPIRVFKDDEYKAAGAEVQEDLSPADVVLAVKEVPMDLLKAETTYLFFSHTIKGQAYNMPLLQRILDLKATLIDYERITDEQNRRLIFFSIHAGYAGTIETLRAWGLRMLHEGVKTPLADIKPAYEYGDLADAMTHLRAIGARIEAEGLGAYDKPLIIGIAGYGNVSRGSQELLDCLPIKEIQVDELETAAAAPLAELGPLVKVVFHEEDMVEPKAREAQFVLQDYYQHPGNYRGVFPGHLAYLDVLINTIYWEDKYPRLVSRKWAKGAYGGDKNPRLRVIGDISCDIGGGIELTVKATMPDEPCYVVDPDNMEITVGVVGKGPVIMAVDNLPCELPRESSISFSQALRDMVPDLAQADFSSGFETLILPAHLKKAVIAHRGELTPNFRYLQAFLDKASK